MKSKKVIVFVVLISISMMVYGEKLRVKTYNDQWVQLDYQAPQILYPTPNQQQQQPKLPNIGPLPQPLLKNLTAIQSSNNSNQMLAKLLLQAQKHFLPTKQQFKLEYHYYNNKYNFDAYPNQKPMCVISPFHNFFAKDTWKMYLDVLEHQNYTNFHVVMSDDVSTDNSADKIIWIVERFYPRLRRRLRIVRNREYVEMMGNADIQIRNHCQHGEIVVEADGDDSLVGLQVLKVLNAYYTANPHLWLVHSNFLLINKWKILKKYGNYQIPEQVLASNSYRTSNLWVTSHLKTFYRDLYMKIPPEYLCMKPGRYFLFAADIFTIIPMVEMASKGHVQYLDEVVYYYHMTSDCGIMVNKVAETRARMLAPFLPLQNYQDQGVLMPNYTPANNLIQNYNKAIKQSGQCLLTFREKISDPTLYSPITN